MHFYFRFNFLNAFIYSQSAKSNKTSSKMFQAKCSLYILKTDSYSLFDVALFYIRPFFVVAMVDGVKSRPTSSSPPLGQNYTKYNWLVPTSLHYRSNLIG